MKRIFITIFLLPFFLVCYSQNSLFKKIENNPILEIGSKVPDWRSTHVANAAILRPEETHDGTWRIYARGNEGAGGQIGILFQDSAGFSPYGPWEDYQNNPVLGFGPSGSYDDKGLLDCAPVVGENGTVYFYYKAKSFDGSRHVAGAKSNDGGYTFQKFDTNPLLTTAGINDVVYHNQKYYIFHGRMIQDDFGRWVPRTFVRISSDPQNIKDVDTSVVLTPGGGPDNFDSKSLHGTRIFRLDNKWFMVYQGSDRHIDFPHRFHAAYSDDLVNWTKVDNDFPLLERGYHGEWDQGAIWYGEVFEHQDTLFMFYEGWGCYCIPENRNQPYFPGNSRTGLAKVPVEDFLLWADGGFDSSWMVNEFADDGTIVDFEDRHIHFNPTNEMTYEVISNPVPDDVNSSEHVGKIITTFDRWELLWSEPFETRFDFSDGYTFKMKVYTEVPGDVYFKLEHPTNYRLGQVEVKKTLETVNEWVDMEFDFTPLQPWSDLYGKILLLFDAGGTEPGHTWYFDDIRFLPMGNSVFHPKENPDSSLKILYDIKNQRIKLKEVNSEEPYVVYSMTGSAVKHGKGNQINISGLEKGCYVIKSGKASARFIK